MPDRRHLRILELSRGARSSESPTPARVSTTTPVSVPPPPPPPMHESGPDLASAIELFGPAKMSDADLVALLLRGRGPAITATRLLEGVGGLAGLGAASIDELRRTRGVGPAAAASVVAAVELSRRLARCGRDWAMPLRRPTDVAEYMRAQLRGASQEHFVVLGLDARQRVILQRTVAVGSLARVDVHPRELFRPLVRQGAHAAVMVHNHPSGDPQPSDADVELTRRMVEVGKLVGIAILDHLVVSDTGSVSLASLGLV